MFAIIETGGKQYKVEKGNTLEIEKIEAEDGATITLDKVLLISDQSNLKIGNPMIDGAAVMAKIVRQTKGEKLRIYKMKAKEHYQRTAGHRQKYTLIEVTDIKDHGVEKTVKPAGKTEAKTTVDIQATTETPKKAPVKKKAVRKTVQKAQ